MKAQTLNFDYCPLGTLTSSFNQLGNDVWRATHDGKKIETNISTRYSTGVYAKIVGHVSLRLRYTRCQICLYAPSK